MPGALMLGADGGFSYDNLPSVVIFAGPPRGQNVQDYQREAIELDTFNTFEVSGTSCPVRCRQPVRDRNTEVVAGGS